MINTDDRLIREVLPTVGVDAFAALMAISSHMGKDGKRKAWPGIKRLQKMCKVMIKGELRDMPRKRIYDAIATLVKAGLVSRKQENKAGEWGKVVYRVTTSYIKIMMDISALELEGEEDCDRVVKLRNTEMRNTENDHTEDINKGEGINKGEEYSATDVAQPCLSDDFENEYSFDAVWEKWGHKRNKKAAQSAFRRKSKKELKRAVDAIDDYLKFLAHPRNADRPQLMLSTWLNSERYDDDWSIAEEVKPQASGQTSLSDSKRNKIAELQRMRELKTA